MKCLLFLLSFILHAHASQRESHLDLISKAQNLSLQHDRLQAAQILSRALKAEKPGTPASRQLRKALDELTEIFYTEKAQKIYALAQSLEDPRASAEKLDEALSLEPGHTGVLKAMARARLRGKECEVAHKAVEQALAMNPFSPELVLLRIQALQCLGEYSTARQLLSTEGVATLTPAYETAKIRDLMAEQRWFEAKKKIKDLEARHYPEGYYLLFRIQQHLGQSNLQAGEQYVQACQKLTSNERKKFAIEPSLCQSAGEVDNEIRLRHLEEGIKQ